MDLMNVNGWAILVAAIITVIIGSLWYSSIVFGKVWLSLTGLKEEDVKKNFGWTILGGFISALVLNYVLAIFVYSTNADNFPEGVLVGFLAWLGFIATTYFAGFLWEKRPFNLFLLHSGHMLLILLINGGILAFWP